MFIAALFTIAKYGNSQDDPLQTNALKNVVFTDNGI
jgi:hypothetical protein